MVGARLRFGRLRLLSVASTWEVSWGPFSLEGAFVKVIGRLRARVFYGWWMVASGFGIQVLVSALMQQTYGAYVVLLREDFGWSKTALAAGFSLARFENGMLGPIEGALIDRFGPRAIMRIGIVIFGVGFMLFSQVNSLPAFYGAFFLMALGSSLGSFLPLTVAVVHWFRRRRSIALAVMGTGFAVGGLVVPVVVFFLETFGWRATAFGSGVLVIVAGLPLAQVIRHRPEDFGETVDGGEEGAGAQGPTPPERAAAADVDFTAREALRTPAFWLISLGHGAALLVVSALMVHLVSHLDEKLGYSLGTAALIVTLMTAMQVIGQVSGGYLGDRVSKQAICTACMAGHSISLLLLAYATTLPMVIAFAVLNGLAWGMRGPLQQALRADYFGRASFGVIMGLSSMITMFGNVAGPLIAGSMADATGSYRTGFTLLAIMAGMGSLFFAFARKPPPPSRVRAGRQAVAPAGMSVPAGADVVD